MTLILAKGFICERYVETIKGNVKPTEELIFYDQVELTKNFFLLGDRSNANGESEATVTAKTIIGLTKFRECGKLLNGRKLLLKIEGQIYQNCVRMAMPHGSETWYLWENEMVILKRIK